ncbi:uncharacterized protein TRIVIDRAFT_197641 [Trichoderma virens Gv29-8]|uniref:Uncharacterized protein n=1 Tax=Hypocrea virens (strain Gv29-8 / FGSC 10586) TaxID=413071 RepID=G9MHN4_HYPVG|nr:uncharacterized protein TRIVIDRAFT_197641 [Trichoderma virens Gv29-8]EHK26222.1 hypothetical protein TRIVIDRAFT_197641 [Trichoderma virens Gv29-8]
MAQISTEDDVWPPSAQAQSSTTFRHTDNGASTLSLPPANRSGSDEQPTKPSILTSEIHREVMGLLILVAKQDASPMRSSMAKLPSHDRTELTDSSTILAMQSDMNNDISRATASHSDDQQTWHFDSLGWRQQKGLLQRIIRRLRGWNKVVRGDDEEDNRYLGNDKETEEMAEIYFSTIGKVLTEKEEHIDSSPDHEKSRNSAVERNEPETETIGQVMNPEHKIILRFVTRPNAIQQTTNISNSLNSQERSSKDMPSNLPGNTEEECISQLGENFAAFGIATTPETSSYPMARALLDFAQIAERSGSKAYCLKLKPELKQFLDNLNSIIGLIASLPHWQIFIIPDQNHYAKEAASLICLILVEEAMNCVTDVFLEFRRHIKDSHSMGHVLKEMHFFCSCLRRLSQLVAKHDKTFPRFQPRFREILSKYSNLSSIVFRRTVVEEADYSETEAEDSQIEDDSDEDSQLEDDSDEDSQLEDDSDEDSQLEDGSDEDSQLGDDPAEDSRIEDDSDEDSWIEGLNNDCVLRSEFAEKHLRTTIKCLKSQRQYRPLSIACYLSTDSNHLQLDLARLADTEFPGGFQEVTAGDYFEETELELS